jgi:signal peptidase I
MIERGNLVNIYRVTSHSMTPALLHKDIVLVNQQFNCVSCSHALLIGDIVVFGIDASVSVKRIVGLPGDELLIEDHVLSVNGTQVQGKQVDVDDVAELDRFQKNGDVFEERLGAHVYLALFEDLRGSSMERVQVPPGSVFVLGDNRGGSKDSREYGFISFENIRGRVEQVWFTRDRPLGTRAERAGLSFPSSVSPR